MSKVRRVYVEKCMGYDVEARQLFESLVRDLGVVGLKGLRLLHRYDVSHISDEAFAQALHTIFSEPPVDRVFEEVLPFDSDRVFGVEFLPGQYDQRADSAKQCISILTSGEEVIVKVAKIIGLDGEISEDAWEKIKRYCINPVDSREADLSKPQSLEVAYEAAKPVAQLDGFIHMDRTALESLWKDLGLAMSMEDLLFTQNYFKYEEKRNPTLTEIRVLDTYWSDHCRHTTFLTELKDVVFNKGKYNEPVENAYEVYMADRKKVYQEKEEQKPVCFMDLATLAMKKLRQEGKLDDLEISDEINACSIRVMVDVNGQDEEWLVMFKNETHNHPTEIEPFGGAATCLGGAIRDPLSGRSYVYQAMRVTGSADPTVPINQTLPNKLPQRKITTEAAHGYSSYGNQIGLSTGLVREIYHPGYCAKHLEIGAVIGAAPSSNVIRETSEPGNIIVLLGGRTGRDGCGGATGSSKQHTKASIHTCGAEVQKGNPPTERKIQRLFRKPEVSQIIRKCNDFGAGGVSVAIGELADGLIIDLDAVPKKYAGLDGTELAISESQERMAVVLNEEDVDAFIQLAEEENLEATITAVVTQDKRLIMKWQGEEVVNVSREFLNTNGAKARTTVEVLPPQEDKTYFDSALNTSHSLKEQWLDRLKDLNVCSQKGLIERFDSSIGASNVLMPFGGKYQQTPIEVMASKLPVQNGDTTTGTLMAYGYHPYLSSWSPFHGAVYAVVDSVAKIVAAGGDYSRIRFTFQEYFKRLGTDPKRWGEPLSSLLGAYYAQKMLELPSIGGKDSMSGTFEQLDVPPTLVSFAVAVVDVQHILSPELKEAGHSLIAIDLPRDAYNLPDFNALKSNYMAIRRLITEKKVMAAHTIGCGGIVESISKMAFGNRIGVKIQPDLSKGYLFEPKLGAILLEVKDQRDIEAIGAIPYTIIGKTIEKAVIDYKETHIELDEMLEAWQKPLEKIFSTQPKEQQTNRFSTDMYHTKKVYICKNKITKPTVFLPVFPGTNCEYDTQRVFEKAGAQVETMVFKNLQPNHIEESVQQMCQRIKNSQIIMLAGGFSAGDEPDGSGKFISTIFRNARIKEAVDDLLQQRDGLMLGICNGFQALIKLGLVPYGQIMDLNNASPTLTYNTLGRHVSCMVQTKIVSNLSPWFSKASVGDIHTIPVSHGEGRFVAKEGVIKSLLDKGQVATQYVDLNGNPSMECPYNPNGSVYAIEGITSPDGRVLGKMGHSERMGSHVSKNIIGEKDQMLFQSGVAYFSN